MVRDESTKTIMCLENLVLYGISVYTTLALVPKMGSGCGNNYYSLYTSYL